MELFSTLFRNNKGLLPAVGVSANATLGGRTVATYYHVVVFFLGVLIGCLTLSTAAQAQTVLKAGDLVITAVHCTDPDDFSFAPLVDLAPGTQIAFTDNGWLATGGFRANEGTATYTAPATVKKGTLISFQNNSGFVFTNNFLLSSDGDQLLAYQGKATAPIFLYGYSYKWSKDATSDNTSALPNGLRDGVTAVALGLVNTYMNQTALRRGAGGQLRPWFSTPANWTGSNTKSNRALWPTSNLTIETVQANTVAGVATPNSTQNRVQELILTEPNFAAYQLEGDLTLADNATVSCGTLTTKSAKLLLRLDTGPVHNSGDITNPFTTTFDIRVTGCGGTNCTIPLLNTLTTNVPLRITTATTTVQTPRQTYMLDLAPFLTANPGMNRVNVQLSALVVSPTNMRQHMRLVARLEQELRISPPKPSISSAAAIATAYDKFETVFAWGSSCQLVRNYQVQILKLPEPSATTGTPPLQWLLLT